MHPDDPSASAGTWPATAVLVEAQRREIGVGHRPPVEIRHGGQRPGPLSHAALQHVPCSPVATRTSSRGRGSHNPQGGDSERNDSEGRNRDKDGRGLD